MKILFAVLAVMGMLGACNFSQTDPLVDAVSECDLSANPYVTVDEGGLIMNGRGESSPGADIDDIACVLYQLDVPSTMINRMDTTNSLMGEVEGSWDNFVARWTYHPDNGFNIFITAN